LTPAADKYKRFSMCIQANMMKWKFEYSFSGPSTCYSCWIKAHESWCKFFAEDGAVIYRSATFEAFISGVSLLGKNHDMPKRRKIHDLPNFFFTYYQTKGLLVKPKIK
jgi:hypothetical protein